MSLILLTFLPFLSRGNSRCSRNDHGFFFFCTNDHNLPNCREKMKTLRSLRVNIVRDVQTDIHTIKFGHRPFSFHILIIEIKNKLNKQTVITLMRRLIKSIFIWIFTVCKCMSEFTRCPKLPDFTLWIIWKNGSFRNRENLQY